MCRYIASCSKLWGHFSHLSGWGGIRQKSGTESCWCRSRGEGEGGRRNGGRKEEWDCSSQTEFDHRRGTRGSVGKPRGSPGVGTVGQKKGHSPLPASSIPDGWAESLGQIPGKFTPPHCQVRFGCPSMPALAGIPTMGRVGETFNSAWDKSAVYIGRGWCR